MNAPLTSAWLPTWHAVELRAALATFAPAIGPQPIYVPAHPSPDDGHARLYVILREGREATIAWNEACVARNGLAPLLAQLDADRVGLPSERPDLAEVPAEERPAPVAVASRAVATGDNDPVTCECGLVVTFGGYLALHRAGVAHLERMAPMGGAS